ncbi:uridine kinase [Agromyces sp. H66]|uniref:uridine kinase n=1 Tax=Agromyces sp. H66 TaxID=2529859 RepID=UPI0010AB4612|nr:uridine kinase [Agromyces sp. H66]
MIVGIEAIAQLVHDSVPSDRRALVAIDGVDGSGKSTFARALARDITTRPVVLIHADDFLNPASIRHRRGRSSPEGFWLDSYDYDALAREVLRPLRPSGDGRYRARSYDRATDTGTRPALRRAPRHALVLIEGLFLHRDGLVAAWDFSVFLDVPFPETARRMAARDGSHPDPDHASMRRYMDGQRLYFAAARPWERASIVVENSDPGRPHVIAPEAASAARNGAG